MLTMLESLNYSFRNPKNVICVIYRIKQLRNYKKKKHWVLRGLQLGKKRCRARLGILRVMCFVKCCVVVVFFAAFIRQGLVGIFSLAVICQVICFLAFCLCYGKSCVTPEIVALRAKVKNHIIIYFFIPRSITSVPHVCHWSSHCWRTFQSLFF